MTLETTLAKTAADAARTTVRTAETGIKKAWSILDAASEKRLPGETLSPRAVQAIQGRAQGGPNG